MRDQTADNRVLCVGKGPVVDGNASRGLPKDGDLGCISTKGDNVVAHPLDSKTLVAEAQVVDIVRCARKTEDVETVVYSYDYDVLRVGEVLTVVKGRVGGADGGPSAVEKDEHRALFTVAVLLRCFRPDIQCQAVLVPSGTSVSAEVVNDLLSLWGEKVEVERQPRALGTVAGEVSTGTRYPRLDLVHNPCSCGQSRCNADQ